MKTIITINFLDKTKEKLVVVKDEKIDVEPIKKSLINDNFIEIENQIINTKSISDVKFEFLDDKEYYYNKLCEFLAANYLVKEEYKDIFYDLYDKIGIEKIKSLFNEFIKEFEFRNPSLNNFINYLKNNIS